MMDLVQDVKYILHNDERCIKLYLALEQHKMTGFLKHDNSYQLQKVLIEFVRCKAKCQETKKENDKLKDEIKNMQINNANNNMFHQAFLSAYNHVVNMDLPYDIKEEILEAFDKREIE